METVNESIFAWPFPLKEKNEGRVNSGLCTYVEVVSSYFFVFVFLILSVSSSKVLGCLMHVTTICMLGEA